MEETDLKVQIFSIINEHYRHDFDLFWQRTNFFLLLEVGLLGFYFSEFVAKADIPLARLFLLVTGVGLSILWFLVAWSSVRWIAVWRHKVIEIDYDLNPYKSFSTGEAVEELKWRFHLSLRPEVVAAFMPLALGLLWIAVGLARVGGTR